MITRNIIQRVFCAQFPDGAGRGTCFAVEMDNKQYLITARHLAHRITSDAKLSIFHDGAWKDLSVKLIGHCDDVDISVLTAEIQLAPTHPTVPSSMGIVYGQDVYFLGYPYLEEDAAFQKINNGYPMPFIKKGILSCMTKGRLFLDGYNNPGFSGGPVVFQLPGKQEYQIAGVISGYRYEKKPVVQAGGIHVAAHVRENTGIIVAHDIKRAVDMIKSRPQGFPVKI